MLAETPTARSADPLRGSPGPGDGRAGQTPRSVPGDRLELVFERTADAVPEAVAVEVEGTPVTYGELDTRANRLAHVLRDRGAGPRARVAILLERSLSTYVALLAAGKAGATFVPIDPASPADRVAYVAEDAAVDLVVTSTAFTDLASGLDRPWLAVDDVEDLLAAAPTHRPTDRHGTGTDTDTDTATDTDAAAAPATDPVAYIIYTSGSSGRPKGVAVAQSSIANFVAVASEVYDVRPDDRVYQGMTISFDFSIEEIWPTWAVGATLVAGPDDERRLGADLADFLDDTGVTVLYCVPTLLATIPRDLPKVRAVMVGGEACPAELVERWSTPERRMLNTYGPTEDTVTATWTELVPGRAVTIGRPMPTYDAQLTDPEDPEHPPVDDGAIGEITLGGPGVAVGYVGRPDLTAEKFIPDPADHSRRVYRTGDLGRFTDDGEIEYLGRADAEVKVRGHRVDLGEIESVLLTDAEVGAAVVAPDPGGSGDLAAYVVPPQRAGEAGGSGAAGVGDEAALATRVHGELSARLPGYMVPATLDVLDALPTQASGKVDRTALQPPSGRRLLGDSGPVVGAEGGLEEQIVATWAGVFALEPSEVSVEADFFDDLGGHSLLAATAATALRERLDGGTGATVAVRDLYTHPTIRGLATHLEATSAAAADAPPAAPRHEPARHSSGRVAAAGLAQAGYLYLFLLVAILPLATVYSRWTGTVTVGWVAGLVGAAVAVYLGSRWVLPLLARPLGAGVRPGRYRLWGATYLRLWLIDQLLALSPLPRLGGSPLAAPYLRLLGGRVGHRTHLATADVGLPALVEIGDDASIGYGAHLRPWAVEDGWVVVAPVRVGADAVVGTGALVEPGGRVGDRALLAEQSVVPAGVTVPDGEAWQGSPAARTGSVAPEVEVMRSAEPLPGWRPRHVAAALVGVVGLELATLLMVLPSTALVVGALLWGGVGWALGAAAMSGVVSVLSVCTVVALGRTAVLPRTPTGVHPARSGLGLRKWIADALLTDSLTYTNTLYATLYTVPWLRLLGARIGAGSEVSTASHLDPDLLTVGRQGFVADMASVGCASFAHGRMALERTEVGDRAFLGNAAIVPAGTTTGDGSLVGVHTVPPRTAVTADSSWLGSPAIHLPRRQDSGDYDESETFRPGRGRVAGRLAIEFLRIVLPGGLSALAAFGFLSVLLTLATTVGVLTTALLAPFVAIAAGLAILAVVVGLKWLVVGRYRPRTEPLWNVFVRRTELVTGLYEGAVAPAMLGSLSGTPFLPAVLRLFGARIGRRVWLGTTFLTEFDLVEIGDDAAVGRRVSLQTHLFEDRVMKMSHVRIGDAATVGDRSVVLYDASVGAGVDLEPLSLLMKGEHLGDGTRWRGIPAQAA